MERLQIGKGNRYRSIHVHKHTKDALDAKMDRSKDGWGNDWVMLDIEVDMLQNRPINLHKYGGIGGYSDSNLKNTDICIYVQIHGVEIHMNKYVHICQHI